MRTLTLSILGAVAVAGMVVAQAPTPVVITAASPGATFESETVALDKSNVAAAALRTLEEMKAANEETLRKQAATLQKLDELEKAADQLRIFAKRG